MARLLVHLAGLLVYLARLLVHLAGLLVHLATYHLSITGLTAKTCALYTTLL